MQKSLLALTVVLLAAVLVLAKTVFEVKSIEVKGGQNCIDNGGVESQLHVIQKNIFFTDTSKLEETLKQKNICLDFVSIHKIFPSKIVFDVVSQNPVAKIEGTDLQITSNGLVMKMGELHGRPTIYLPNNTNVQQGDIIEDKYVLFALNLASDLLKSDFSPSGIRFVSNRDIAIYSTAETVALFTTEKSSSGQVDSLQAIMTKAKIDASKIAKVDLRFDKPIITNK